LLLIVQILMKPVELCKHIVTQALSVQYIVCRLGDARKSMSLTFKKLQKFVWKKDGDSPLDYTSAYSEMPGAPNYINDKHKTAMKAPTKKKALDDELREKGLI
jgi:hypothetical protein